jgi:hypothetical protein
MSCSGDAVEVPLHIVPLLQEFLFINDRRFIHAKTVRPCPICHASSTLFLCLVASWE